MTHLRTIHSFFGHSFSGLFRMTVQCVMMVCLALTAFGAAARPALANAKYASIVIDADTGQVLSQSNADKILHPASLTKMMTLLMLFDSMQARKVGLNDKISISSHAASMQPSKLGLPVGSTIRVEDAIKALVTKSANDISVAVAEFIGGSEENFARMMTMRAQQLGMTRTRFVNASGLHDPRQVSSARDMARLSLVLVKQYPTYYSYFSIKNFTYRGKSHHNHNRLMSEYKGMDGLKTGFVNASGFNLAASAKRNGRRLVGVVFGGRTWKSRNDHMAVLLDRGFEKIFKDPAPTGAASGIMASHNDRIPIVQGPSLAALPATPVTSQSLIPDSARKPFKGGYKKLPIAPLNVPVPASKPALGAPVELAAAMAPILDDEGPIDAESMPLAQIEPAAGAAVLSQAQDRIMRAIATTIQERRENALSAIMGQGDVDEDSAIRFQTGLMAIAAHTHREYSIEGIGRFGSDAATPKPFNTNLTTAGGYGNWSAQVGAFKSRAQTDDVLRAARTKLPNQLLYGQSVIMPTTMNGEILFRGRLSGYNEEDARQICQIIAECMVVSPVQ